MSAAVIRLNAFPCFWQLESCLFTSSLPNNDKTVSQWSTNASAAGEQTNSVSRRVLSDWYFSLICLNSFKSPSRPNSPSSYLTFSCSTNHPSPLFLAMEPGSVVGFCSMWDVLKGLSDVPLGSSKPTTHHFLYSLVHYIKLQVFLSNSWSSAEFARSWVRK